MIRTNPGEGSARALPSRRPGLAGVVAALGFVAIVSTVIAVPLAGAHAVVRPVESRPADFQQYTLTVPTERDVPTVEVALKVPAGVGFLLVEDTPGWEATVVRRQDRIDEIRWSGGRVLPDHFVAFRFIARNPVAEGELDWKVVQRYEGGEVARWIGPAGSESPAARTLITEAAVPVDVVDVVSGRSASTASGNTSVSTTESSSERDTLAIALGGAALAVAVVGLLLALVAIRRSRTAGRGSG